MLADYIGSVDGFDALSQTDKIRHFAWYLDRHRNKQKIRTSDITGCFDEVHLHRPKNASQMVSSLIGRDLIRDGDGFRVAKRLRDVLDAKQLGRDETIAVDVLLSELPAKLSDVAQQDYLHEALVCFRHRAFRAAVVMTWNIVYDHLVTIVVLKHLTVFNANLAGMFGGKKKPVATRDDFQQLKEFETIQVCIAAGIVSKEVGKVLKEKLDKRNSSAHPSGARIDKLQTEAFISDLLNNAMLKIC
jgi:hypothetical protein